MLDKYSLSTVLGSRILEFICSVAVLRRSVLETQPYRWTRLDTGQRERERGMRYVMAASQPWGTVYCVDQYIAIYILLPEANIAIYAACLRRILRYCNILYSEATIYCYMEFSISY